MPPFLSPSLLLRFQPFAVTEMEASGSVFFRAPDGSSSMAVGRNAPQSLVDLLRGIRDEAVRRQNLRATESMNGVGTVYEPGGVGSKWSLESERAEAVSRRAHVIVKGANTFLKEATWLPTNLEIRRHRSSMEALFSAIQWVGFATDVREPSYCQASSRRRALIARGWHSGAMKDLTLEKLSADGAFKGWQVIHDRTGATVRSASGERLRVSKETRQVTVEWELNSTPLPSALESLWAYVVHSPT